MRCLPVLHFPRRRVFLFPVVRPSLLPPDFTLSHCPAKPHALFFPDKTSTRYIPPPPDFIPPRRPAQLPPPISHCDCLPAGLRPPPLAAVAAMARARRRSRAPGGRTERRSRRGHHPARPGRSAPTPTRHAAGGVQPNLRDAFRSAGKRGVRGCRGCRGGASPSHPMPRAGQATCRPRRATAAIQGRRKKELFAGQATCRPLQATAAMRGRKKQVCRQEERERERVPHI